MSFLKNFFGPPDIEKLKEQRDVDGLLKIFSTHKDFEMRAAAASALGELGDKRAVEPMLADRSASYELTLAIVKALGSMGDVRATKKLLGALGHPREEMRHAITQSLIQLGESAVPSITHALIEGSPYNAILIKVLYELGEKGIEPLVQALRDTHDTQVAADIVTVLGHTSDHRATPQIARMLLDRKTVVSRIVLIDALGNLRDERAVDTLLGVLNDAGTDRMARKAAAFALGKIGSERAKDALLKAYNGKDIEIAAGAAAALKMIGYMPPLEPLLEDLKLDNVVRRKALLTIAAFGDVRAVKPLVAYIEDADNSLLKEAVDTLRSIDPETAQVTVKRLCAKGHAFGGWHSVMPQFKQDNRYMHTGERVCQRCGEKELCTRHDFGDKRFPPRYCVRCGYKDSQTGILG